MKNVLLLFISLILREGISQNIWEPTNGPNGMEIVDVVVTTDSVLVVSVAYSGIFISKDNGLHWQKMNKGLKASNSFANHLAAGPNGIVYAVTEYYNLYRLDSISDQWHTTQYKLGFGENIICNSSGYLYTNFHGGSFDYSRDKGITFKKVNLSIKFDAVHALKFYGNDKNFIYASESGVSNLYKMNDNGTNIVKITNLPKSITDFYWHPDGYLFIGYYDNSVIRMDENGSNIFINNSNSSPIRKFVLKRNGSLFAFADGGDYETNDYGIIWKKNQSAIYKHMDQLADAFFLENNLWLHNEYCEYGQLQYTADDGKNWGSIDQSFLSPTTEDLFIDKLGRIFAKTCGWGRYSYSLDKGLSWQSLKLPNDIDPAISLVSTTKGELLAISQNKLFKSNDLGNSWIQVSIQGNHLFNSMYSNGGNIIYLFNGVNSFFSKDDGDNWSNIIQPPITVDNIYYHPDGTVFAVCKYSTCNSNIYFSENEGLSWKSIDYFFGDIYSFCIAKNGSIFISNDLPINDLLLSKDKLKTFIDLNVNSESAVIDENGLLYSTYSTSCYKSSDEGQSWEPYFTGLPSNTRKATLALGEDNHLYMGLYDDVIYKSTNTVTATTESKIEKLEPDVMIQPNPVSIKLTIAIQSDKIHFPIKYQIDNMVGKAALAGNLSTHINSISVESIPNGIYFLKFDDPKLPVEKIVVEH